MLELIKNKENSECIYQIASDGQILEDVYVRDEKNHLYFYSKNRKTNNIIISSKIKDLLFANSFRLEGLSYIEGFRSSIALSNVNNNVAKVEYQFDPDLLNWNFPFTALEYFALFSELWIKENDNDELVKKSHLEGTRFITKFNINIDEQILADEIDKSAYKILKIQRKTRVMLESKIREKSITKFFKFPEELEVPCEQYLLYFAQFLQDLGINATPNLKEEAGKVLFSVTPTDDIEALDKIRKALAVYLSLPSSPVIYNDSFQSMQLKQQVENLQHSQRMKEMEMRSAQYALRLAQQNIENQDKIIIQQNSFIDNQNKIIEKIMSKSIMIDSLENKEDLEKFCEGFEVGHSKWLYELTGIKANLAKVIKTGVKNTIGKEENKSVLGLDEED